ncbi:glycoside hydrolase family 24 protein [Acinetobacter halotolerans]|uniref:glycoside hydrolase family 24 protein n=1 Tax=Acinetobacter halotolerans TaxID=1752076 RepID=UPI001D18B6B7|nr:glycoside hydrolase family 104 protein [Acinetobacter halotolerans]
MATRQQIEQMLGNPNVRKMLDLIAKTEGVAHGYNTLFGNQRIDNLSAHPNIRKQFKQTDGKTNYTTAAGRYQFLKNTWDGLAKQYGLNDFSSKSQDVGAIALLAQNGALPHVLKGDFNTAIQKSGGTWASLPSSPYAQPKKSWEQTNKLLGSQQTHTGVHKVTTRALNANDIVNLVRQKQPQQKPPSSGTSGLNAAQIVALVKEQQRSNFKPFDWKASEKEATAKQANEAGPTKFWESALLGVSDLGAGVLQGTSYAADKISSGVNSVLGTNLDTGSYDRVTKKRTAVDEWHEARRQAHDQGYDVTRLGGQIAATAPMAALGRTYQGAKVLSGAGARVAGQNAAVGAAMGGVGFAEDANQRLGNTALGAIGGAAGGALGEKIGQGVTAIARKVKPQNTQKILQQIDEKLDKALQQQGMSLGELSDDVVRGLRSDAEKLLKSGKDLNADAVARKAVLDRLGLKGTRAQVSGNAQDWQKQAELAKISGSGDQLRDKLIDDNVQLQRLLNEATEKTGGKATDQYGAMKNALDSVNTQLQQNKGFIGAAYDVARKADGNNIVLDGRGFANDAFTKLDEQYAATSLPAGIQKILKDVADNPDKFTLGKSEELIKILNREYKSSLQMGQPTSATHSIGLVRDALEGRQKEAMQGILSSGNDAAQAYQFARQANKFNMEQIEGMPLLQDARKGIEPDKLFNKHILNGNVKELDKTIDLLNNINPQAVGDIKQQVLEYISSKAVNQNGQFSPAGMKRALDAISDRRLQTMFSTDELKNIKDISKAGHYLVTQPPHSYVNNSNTASAVMNYFSGIINKPGVRMLLAPIKDVQDSRAVNQALSPDLSGRQLLQSLTQQERALIDRLVRAGVITGAETSNQ